MTTTPRPRLATIASAARNSIVPALVAAAALLGACGSGDDGLDTPDAGTPLAAVPHGFTAFPYDLSQEALDRTHDFVVANSDLYAVHNDGSCLPWREMLAGEPVTDWLLEEWRAIRARIPSSHKVYISITPTQADRVTMIQQCGSSENEPGTLPPEIAGARYDAPAVVRAYLAYARAALDVFRPDFVNLAIEISEMSLTRPDLWPQLEALYLATVAGLRQSHPTVKLGLELVLQSLLLPRVAEQVRPAVEASDYLGISFYPYGSEFGVVFGAPALPPPPAQWRMPLEFLRSYTDKPVALCETGYTTKDRVVQTLRFPGTEQLQRDFLHDLIDEARREAYLFAIWFVPIDYEALMEKLGAGPDDAGFIWVNAGLLDRDQRPKPGFAEWQRWAAR